MNHLDLEALGDRLRAALSGLTIKMVDLEHSDTLDLFRALSIESPERIKDHVYRMTIALLDGKVNFFAHVHGTSKDLTTQGAHRFVKDCANLDEVFTIIYGVWTGSMAS